MPDKSWFLLSLTELSRNSFYADEIEPLMGELYASKSQFPQPALPVFPDLQEIGTTNVQLNPLEMCEI